MCSSFILESDLDYLCDEFRKNSFYSEHKAVSKWQRKILFKHETFSDVLIIVNIQNRIVYRVTLNYV